ncbi:glycosyltransferase family 2 protein [Capnocytophaga canis]|uniref:glycosyltransferase family 2 protein n=1 Tax=Capnocytophaga canis TaxID=1848903 RepID=UPI0037D0087E
MKTSLIITTYNRPDALQLVFESILSQKVLPDEVIIADDGSTNETKLLIRKYSEKFPIPMFHAWQPDNGFRLAEARNRGIAKSSGNYIVFIDGDMVLHPLFIADHKKSAKRGFFIQGGRILLTQQKTTELLKNPTQYRILKWYEKGLEKRFEKRFSAIHIPLLSNFILKKVSGDYKGIRGCNFSFFRDDAFAINGFNNDFVGWGREDSEFVVRFLNNGGKRVNIKFSAIAYHLWHKEEDRTSLSENDVLLNKAIKQKLVWCENGIDKIIL